jgi:Fe2+ or Zn2+ uptake regulation protein
LEIEKYLRQYGIKVTKGRINVLDIINNANQAVNVDYIFKECKKRNLHIDLSTVYRSLELFENKEIIKKFDLGQGKSNYRIRKEDHKHILQCKLCQKEVEIDCPMQQVKELIKDKTGFTFIEKELDLKLEGICEECTENVKK